MLGYYGNLVFEVKQYQTAEEQMIKKAKEIISHQEDIEDNSSKTDVNIYSTVYSHYTDSEMNQTELVPDEERTQNDNRYPNNNQTTKKEKVQEKLPQGFDSIMSIPSISLEKIVYTGDLREERLEQYDLITAAKDMTYLNGGNYIVCGHYSQVYGHSLNRLKELKKGDYVYINSNNILHKYKVYSKTYETMTDTSSFCTQTEQRELTIISCARYIGADQYIVIKCKFIK